MKNNIKMVLLILAAVLTTTLASAQKERPQGPPPLPSDGQIKEMVADMAKELSLTDKQEEQVSDLYFEHFEKAEELQKSDSGNRGGGREAMENLKADLEENVNALLTKEQQKLYKAWMEEKQTPRGKQGRPQGKNR